MSEESVPLSEDNLIERLKWKVFYDKVVIIRILSFGFLFCRNNLNRNGFFFHFFNDIENPTEKPMKSAFLWDFVLKYK